MKRSILILLLLIMSSIQLQAQSEGANQTSRSEIRAEQLEAYFKNTLYRSPILESTSRVRFMQRLADELELVSRQPELLLQGHLENRQVLKAKENWFGVNEGRMTGVLIRKRDRDQSQTWQLTDQVQMQRNEEGLLTRLRTRQGQIPDTTVLITEYEYDSRGYPLEQRSYVQDSIRQHLFLHLRLNYDSLGRLERIREHRYSLIDSTLHDSVQTQFQYQNQQRLSVRVENGVRGAMHSDTTRIQYQEGNGTEPLRLMIHRSELDEEEPGGPIYRKNSWLRYTYPDMQTMADYYSRLSNYYDLAPYTIDEYNPMSGQYREQFRIQRTEYGPITRLSHQLWISGGSWHAVEEVYVTLDKEGFPYELNKYDASQGDLYLYEDHEIESQEQATTTESRSEAPGTVLLYQNYPNPFNPVTQITFELMEPEWVTLNVYDALGRRIRTLVDGVFTSGRHQMEFNGARLPSGQYYYRLEVGDVELTKVMTLAK